LEIKKFKGGIKLNSKMMVGAWTKFRSNISEEDKRVFNNAMEGLMGVNYEPVAVATQVVEGTNYRFFCNSQVVRPDSFNEASMVTIWRRPNGDTEITNISNIE
jgi:hypothetical protein